MSRSRFTVRVRLTLLYTVLFALCGTALIAITYGLLAANLPLAAAPSDKVPGRTTALGEDNVPPPEFVNACNRILNGVPTSDENLRTKCKRAFDEGVLVGAETQRQATLDALLWQCGLGLAAATLLAAVAGWFAAGRVLRPVHRLTTAARSASEHNLAARVALGGPRDELRELADTFDSMLERLQRAFAGQRQFIANASHELRTPLTVMRTSVDVVLAKPAPTEAELVGMARDVRAAVDHAEVLIEALLTLARSSAGLAVREPADLATVVEDVLDGADLRDRHAHVALEPAPTAGDPVLLERLAANLVDNAVRYNEPGGDVWLTTSTVRGHVRLEIANRGPVVAPDSVAALFQPFHRLGARTGEHGSGLGLAIVAAIAQVHQGTVDAQPNTGGGLRITVLLPAIDPEPVGPGRR
ncbi:ATP-binding protein [Dactylosporangium sp. NPDC051541]|uniref:HAMP domain-containing sensor histidine kinase n=1 Tax=Dactylosporangium sp. NPDC051541 TaxID=3363977 RepID=UPI0037AAB19B